MKNVTKYVVGFMFDATGSKVSVIRKNRPSWQHGLINGIGGHVEKGESSLSAVAREFKEESGVETIKNNWKKFCSMRGTNNDKSSFPLDFFYTVGDVSSLRTMTDEEVIVADVKELCSGSQKTVGNIPWLVALARDFVFGCHPPMSVVVVY